MVQLNSFQLDYVDDIFEKTVVISSLLTKECRQSLDYGIQEMLVEVISPRQRFVFWESAQHTTRLSKMSNCHHLG